MLTRNEHKAICSLIESPELKRLKGISFLGGIDLFSSKLSKSYKKSSRYDHTIGVLKNTLIYLNSVDSFSQEYRINSIFIAMLHDLGHPPFSHSAEKVMKNLMGRNHHEESVNIIMNSNRIKKIINENGGDIDNIIDSILMKNTEFNFILKDKINMDTIDGIFRCLYSFIPNIERLHIDRISVIKSLADNIHRDEVALSDRFKLDEFWIIKKNLYEKLIDSSYGVFCDALVDNFYLNYVDKHDFLLQPEEVLQEKIFFYAFNINTNKEVEKT